MRFSWLGLISCLVLWACGSDEPSNYGGTTEPADAELIEDEGDEPGEKSEPEEKRDTTDKEYYIKSNLEATGDFSVDSVYDKNTSSYTYRIRTGNIVWYSQRVTKKAMGDESICYGEQNSNCSDYGRLFLATDFHTEFACPDSTRLPSTREWNLLESYRAKYAVIDTLMALEYGGTCEKDSVLKCSGIDTTGYYLTADGKVYVRKKDREKASFIKAKDSSFYNIRCVGYPDFVESKKELPPCDTALYVPARIYVFSEKENYRCYPGNGGWHPDFSESCPEGGKSIVYHDTMMICLSNVWQLADIDYSPDSCTAKTKDSLVWFNGINYYCTGESWRRLTPLEDSIGVCNQRKAGVNDTVFSGIDVELYHCDSNEWREAVFDDYVGSCDDSSTVHMNDTIEFKNVRYICRGEGWTRYTDLEERFGVCTPEKLFMLENGTYDIENRKMEFLCDTSGWVKYTATTVIGKCDASNAGSVALYRDLYYECSFSRWNYAERLKNTYDSVLVCSPKNDGHVINAEDNPLESYMKVVQCHYNSVTDELMSMLTAFPKCYKEDEGKVYPEKGSRQFYCGGAGYWHDYFDDLPLCTTKNIGELAMSKDYGRVACTERGWRNISDLEAKYGVCSKRNEYTFKEDGEERFICLQENWRRYKDPSTFRIQGKAGEDK